ncbi:MAG: Gfo/Idh/MocA family oxidoreductase [Lentilitoribacter sp.]
MSFRFAAIGLDHRHIFGMAKGMLDVGCEFAGFWTDGDPQPLKGFKKRFPDVPRFQTLEECLQDDSVKMVLIAAPPLERARLSIAAMECGKDVMLDKPGCLTIVELEQIKATAEATGRIWSVDFSERFEVPSVTFVEKLLSDGKIGRLVHIISLAPHRLNAHMRPDWFWDKQAYGGILGDIGTHQIDQFLHFSGADNADITHAYVTNLNNPDHPKFQDFGEMNLRADGITGYVRLDWFTPDACPNWGDGRLTLLGTEGYIEIRKYVDVAGQDGTDHVFLVNGDECTRFNASNEETPYFSRLRDDVINRTETACSQRHTFTVMQLAIQAQAKAELN